MRKALLLFLLVGLPLSVRGEWAQVSVEELVQESDVIVVGTLRDVSEYTADETDYGQGRIEVREVIWGRVAQGDSLLLKWHNASALACPRVEHRGHGNLEGIWLLTRDGEDVKADYPGRFVEMSKRRQVEAALARSPVVLRADDYWVGLGEPMHITVVYRNASKAPLTFPGLAFEDGFLRLSPGSRLSVKATLAGGASSRAARLTGRVLRDRVPAPVTVQPGSEYRVEIALRDLLASEPVDGESFEVMLRLEGQPPTNELRLWVGDPLSLMTQAPPPPPAPVRQSGYAFTRPPREGRTPLTRALLAALGALAFFPFFYKLRAARLARAANGVQRWQT